METDLEKQAAIESLCKEFIQSVAQRVARARLTELFEIASMDYWSVEYNCDEVFPKCDKCDDRGYLEHVSPKTGFTISERCPCRWTRQRYHVTRMSAVEAHHDDGSLMLWYKGDHDNTLSSREMHVYAEGDDFAKLDERNTVFKNKSDAEAYAAYKNAHRDEEAGKGYFGKRVNYTEI